MISKMLVSVDHSESSQHAVLLASALARSEKSQVVLQSVVPAYNGDLRLMGRTDVLKEMRLPYKEALQKAKNKVKEFALPLKTILDEGEPFSKILARADIENVDLIVLNRNRQFPVDHIPFGEINKKVIGQSTRDILVVPENASLNLDRILLAYDNSDASQKALIRAIEISLAYGSELIILTAYEVPLEGFAYSPGIWESNVRDVSAPLQEAKKTAEVAGVRNIKTMLRYGKASAEICKLARFIDAGLIIMGCRPVSSMKKILLGNVVEKVIHNESTSVWITKA